MLRPRDPFALHDDTTWKILLVQAKARNSAAIEIAPGVVAAHAGQTVVILERIDGSQVRVRDVATGTEQAVRVGELSDAARGLTRRDTQRRWEAVRGTTR